MRGMSGNRAGTNLWKLYRNTPCNMLERLVIYMRAHFSSYGVIASYVPVSGQVLDLGSGFGILAVHLAASSETRCIKGIDISAHRVNIAKAASSQFQNVSFERGNCLKMRFEGKDCILLIDMLHYFPEPVQNEIIEKCYKGINPEGTLLIRDSNRENLFRHSVTRFHETIMTRSGFTEGDVLFFRKFSKLKGFLDGLGFRVHMMPMWGMTPFADTLMICKKSGKKLNA